MYVDVWVCGWRVTVCGVYEEVVLLCVSGCDGVRRNGWVVGRVCVCMHVCGTLWVSGWVVGVCGCVSLCVWTCTGVGYFN